MEKVMSAEAKTVPTVVTDGVQENGFGTYVVLLTSVTPINLTKGKNPVC